MKQAEVIAQPAHPPAHAAPGWGRALVALVVVLLVTGLVYRETAIAIVTIWYRSETFTHAFLVPPIVLWLVWRRRHEVALIAPQPAAWVLLPLAGLALLWLLGDLTAVNSVTQYAFVAMLVLAVPLVMGLRVAYALMFPLFFLFFGVPTGEFLMPLFMDWTADFTVAALRLSGIPVAREGLQFVIPSGNWSVVEACSGIRYLIASVTVGALYAHLNYQSTSRRILFVIVSILVPVVANWVRAYLIVMAGHLSGNTIAVGVDHLIYGWVFFGVVILLMFFIGARWSEPEPEPFARPVSSALGTARSPHPGKLVLVACLGTLVLLGPLGMKLRMEARNHIGDVTLSAPPLLSGPWQRVDGADLEFKPDFKNPSAESNVVYANAGAQVGLYVAYYRNQDYSRKLVSSNNVLVNSENLDWARVGGSGRQTDATGKTVSVRASELRRLQEGTAPEASRLSAWQIYWIDGSLTANDYVAKAYSALMQLLGRGDESAVIIVYARGPSRAAAEEQVDAFFRANFGAIDALLRQVRDQK